MSDNTRGRSDSSYRQPPGSSGYSDNADELFAQYESISFESVHERVLDLYPTAPSSVLDIGAGSGRDAAALARRGHSVTAVEPTHEFLTKASAAHRSKAISWVRDSLPELRTLEHHEHSFALIILSAVWMHLDPSEQHLAMRRVAELLAPGGVISISVRHGPPPDGRLMFDVDSESVREQASEVGLSCIRIVNCGDPLGRCGVQWTTLVFSAAENA
jgi:SAM-dependent methyltransferase